MDVLVVGVVDLLTYWVAKQKLQITSTVLPNLLFERPVYHEWILTNGRDLPKDLLLALDDLKNNRFLENTPSHALVTDYQNLGSPHGAMVAKTQILKMLS
jgi:lipid A disaccharide synthetase